MKYLSGLLLFCCGLLSAFPSAATNDPLPAVIGPYLQNPISNGMTVCLAARGAEQVRVA